MPLYEYECEKCGEKFEKLMVWRYADEVACPKCGCKAERKIGKIAYWEFKGELA